MPQMSQMNWSIIMMMTSWLIILSWMMNYSYMTYQKKNPFTKYVNHPENDNQPFLSFDPSTSKLMAKNWMFLLIPIAVQPILFWIIPSRSILYYLK